MDKVNNIKELRRLFLEKDAGETEDFEFCMKALLYLCEEVTKIRKEEKK